jgi:hypothetical protein
VWRRHFIATGNGRLLSPIPSLAHLLLKLMHIDFQTTGKETFWLDMPLPWPLGKRFYLIKNASSMERFVHHHLVLLILAHWFLTLPLELPLLPRTLTAFHSSVSLPWGPSASAKTGERTRSMLYFGLEHVKKGYQGHCKRCSSSALEEAAGI